MFSLVSVCCDAVQALVCFRWCQCVVIQSKPWYVFTGVSVLWHSPSLGFLAGVSVLWCSPSLGMFSLVSVCCDTVQALVCFHWCQCVVIQSKPWFSRWCQCVVIQSKPWFCHWCQCVVTLPRPGWILTGFPQQSRVDKKVQQIENSPRVWVGIWGQ